MVCHPSKHKRFVLHLNNVCPTSSTLVQLYINVLQFFWVYWHQFPAPKQTFEIKKSIRKIRNIITYGYFTDQSVGVCHCRLLLIDVNAAACGELRCTLVPHGTGFGLGLYQHWHHYVTAFLLNSRLLKKLGRHAFSVKTNHITVKMT